MLIVLATAWDTSAVSLVSRWSGREALLLAPRNLSERGWVWHPTAPDDSCLVIDGCRYPVGAVDGVVSLMAAVDPAGLLHIVEEDRAYTAAEMGAFLVAWLSWLAGMRIPVVNRPSALSLAGPAFQQEQWLRAAASAGMPILPLVRQLPGAAATDQSTEPPVVDPARTQLAFPVVGRLCLPDPGGCVAPPDIQAGLVRLAASVDASMITGFLAEHDGRLAFTAAAPTVDVTRDDVADALLTALRGAA